MNRSGPYLADELGRFVAAADMSDVSAGALCLLKRNVLDALGCAIAADGEVITATCEQVESVGAAPAATMIGGGRTSIAQATLLNSVRVRYLDLLDTYLAPGGLCHPADNFASLLAVAEQLRARAKTSCSPWHWRMRSSVGSVRRSP